MLQEVRTLANEAAALTGIEPPESLTREAPVLSDSALGRGQELPFYMIGVIGGKNVGKSSLINAIIGEPVTDQSDVGPGTETVIAYAHESRSESLRTLLESHVSGQYRIVTHQIHRWTRQVLLDLPDIDSYFEFHQAITRRMLKHMLYPIWIQSVEKYADRRPKQLLAEVVRGNDPRNFIFCLNKIDQVITREGEDAASELRDEYGQRIARTLGIEPPHVWMVSTTSTDQGELAGLREFVGQDRSETDIQQSQEWASDQHANHLLTWLEDLDLPAQLNRLDLLEAHLQQTLLQACGTDLLGRLNAGLLEDPEYQHRLADEAMQKRVRRWPIVNVLHLLLGPASAVVKSRLALAVQRSDISSRKLVESHLHPPGTTLNQQLQASFARLRQSHPTLNQLLEQQPLWDKDAADQAVEQLEDMLTETIEQQRTAFHASCAKRGGIFRTLVRLTLTIGALVWFPIVQPVLEAWLRPGGISDFALLAVQLMGVTYLLKNAAFLLIYFLFIWLILVWTSRRRAERWLQRIRHHQIADSDLSLSQQTVQWIHSLLRPITQKRQQLSALISRIGSVSAKLGRR